MNIVFGKNGQVANSLRIVLGLNWRFIDSNECDFQDPQNVENFLQSLQSKPQIIINASAYTKVDLAETEQQKAMNINAHSVYEIAKFCKQNNVTLFHYSTDYIFNGNGTKPFNVKDAPSPQNYYGKTKLEGENFIKQSQCNAYILRVSWVCSEFGNNFIKTMLKLMSEKEELSIIADQTGSPTFAIEIANITKQMIYDGYQFGDYHYTGKGFCSWFEFASEILKQATELGFPIKTKKINPITTSQYPTPAKRPLNSRMDCDNLSQFQIPWSESLRETLIKLKNI